MFGPNQKSELFVTKYSSLLTQYVPCGPYGQTRGMRRPVFYRQLWVRNYISHLSLPFRDNPCIQCLVLKSVRRISQRFSEMFSGIKFPSLMNIWNWNWEIFFYVAQIILTVTCYSFAKLWLTLRPRALQHTRLLCPPLSPRVCSNSCPLSRLSYLISSDVFFCCFYNHSQHQGLFQWVSWSFRFSNGLSFLNVEFQASFFSLLFHLHQEAL